MNTIILKKPDGTKFQVNDRRKHKGQLNFHTYGATGQIGKESQEELLLPVGFTMQENGEIETATQRTNRLANKTKVKVTSDDEMLLPIGVELKQ